MNQTARPKNAIRTILLTGLLAGVLDGLAAAISYYLSTHKNPEAVFKFIAKGVFGQDALTGGTGMVIWGILFHFLIAMIWTVLFFLIYPRLKFLSKNLVLTGLVYGLFVWTVMNAVVLPVSHGIPFRPEFPKALLGISFILFLVGLPVSLMIGRYYARTR